MSTETREQYLPRHSGTNLKRLRLWPECWRADLTDAERYALWDQLRLYPPHEASIGWTELAEVAEFLRAQGAKDGEVIAWFDSPHAIYLLLDIKPGFRFMHVYTAISVHARRRSQWQDRSRGGCWRNSKRDGRGKYVINDLEWNALTVGQNENRRRPLLEPPRNPPGDLLPAKLMCPCEFPFNQPTIFRTRNGTGRYIVHRIATREDDPPR